MNFFREVRSKLVRVPRPLKILTVIYLAYLVLVLLIATPLLNIFAPKIYREQTGRELQLGRIVWLNPFTLELDARDVSSSPATQNARNTQRSPNPQSQAGTPSRFWSFDALTANLSLASIWRGHLVFDALELRGLYLQIDQTAPGRYNFSDILDYRAAHFPAARETSPPAAATAATETPFAIEIKKFAFSATHLGYRAPYASEPLAATLTDLNFAFTDFSTLPEKSARPDAAAGAQPSATALPVLRGSNIALALDTIELNFLRAQQPFSTRWRNLNIAIPALSTTAATAQAYALSLADAGGGSLRIKGSTALAQGNTTGSAQLRNIDLIPAWQYLADKLAFTAERAQLDGAINYRVTWGEKFAYQIHDSQLALRAVQLQSRADADTGAAFSALRIEGIAVDSAQPQIHIAHVALDQPVLRGWNRDTKVSLLDMIAFPASDEPSAPSPWHLLIDAIDVADGSVHWRANQLDNRQLTLAPLALHAANLHWPDAAPLQFNASTDIASDDDARNHAKIALGGEIVPGDVTGKIEGAITDLPLLWGNPFVVQQMRAAIADGALNAKFTLNLDKAQPTLVQSEGAIDHFELRAQSDRRKLAAWKKLQWQQLALDVPQQRIRMQRVTIAQPWVQFRINADGTNNFQQLLHTPAPNPATAASATAKPSPAEKTPAKPWRFALTTLQIDKAMIDFRDASLNSAFRTNITELSGAIEGLDSASKKPAKVGLHGTVDGYAPVALTGTVHPFSTQPSLNIALDMTNLDLATLTPYSGTYAGYQIDSGRLTVQLAYTLQDGRIKGTNHIVVNQMQLGQQVRGPKVMDLPLRFAIYLLTDANGVLDLGVDVTGDVDDPDFSVGSIIWKAFRNLIVKTVSSPFRALAHLVGAGSDADLDRVEFAAGSDHIDAEQAKKLATLNKALEEKSELKLSISGHVNPKQDIEALRDEQLSRTLIEQGGITPADLQQQSKNWQREVVKLFKQRFPAEDPEHWQVMQMNDAMRDNEELAPTALQQLATQRALAVKQVLVTNLGLAADRAFIKPVDLGADKNQGLLATMRVE